MGVPSNELDVLPIKGFANLYLRTKKIAAAETKIGGETVVSSKVPGGIANEFAEITNKKKDI